jgi:hypothetical protein
MEDRRVEGVMWIVLCVILPSACSLASSSTPSVCPDPVVPFPTSFTARPVVPALALAFLLAFAAVLAFFLFLLSNFRTFRSHR